MVCSHPLSHKKPFRFTSGAENPDFSHIVLYRNNILCMTNSGCGYFKRCLHAACTVSYQLISVCGFGVICNFFSLVLEGHHKHGGV